MEKSPKLVRSLQDADYCFEGRDDVRHMLVLGYGFGLSDGVGVVLTGIDSVFDFHAQCDCEQYIDCGGHNLEKSVHDELVLR